MMSAEQEEALERGLPVLLAESEIWPSNPMLMESSFRSCDMISQKDDEEGDGDHDTAAAKPPQSRGAAAFFKMSTLRRQM